MVKWKNSVIKTRGKVFYRPELREEEKIKVLRILNNKNKKRYFKELINRTDKVPAQGKVKMMIIRLLQLFVNFSSFCVCVSVCGCLG